MRLALTSVTAALLAGAALFGCNGDNNGPKPPGPPDHIVAVNGLYYKADSLDLKPLVFAVADANGTFLPDQQILLNLLSGDGALSDLAITTDSTGTASFTYEFTGSKGHAVIQLFVVDVDLIEIYIRRSVIIPGSPGHAQYVLLTDIYETVKGFNGLPQSVDNIGQQTLVPNWEDALGMVVAVIDVNDNGDADDGEPVVGIAVNTVYEGTTLDTIPIGIGSVMSEVRTIFGQPDCIDSASDADGPFLRIYYLSLNLEFIGDIDPDTTIIEIELIEDLVCSSSSSPSPFRRRSLR